MCPKTPAIWNNNDLLSLSICLSLWILYSSALSFTWELCFLPPENPELTFTWKTLAKKSYSFWIGKITMLMSSLRCFLQSCWLITFPVIYIQDKSWVHHYVILCLHLCLLLSSQWIIHDWRFKLRSYLYWSELVYTIMPWGKMK